MTKKKSINSKSVLEHLPSKLDAATLSNMAHQPESSGIVPHDDASLQTIIELLTKLSPSNVDLITNIIRVIFDQQTPKN